MVVNYPFDGASEDINARVSWLETPAPAEFTHAQFVGVAGHVAELRAPHDPAPVDDEETEVVRSWNAALDTNDQR